MAVLTSVFSRLVYTIIALGVASVILSVSVWLPNLPLITQVLSSKSSSAFEKINLLLSFYSSLQTNFTVIGAITVLLIATLLGMNTALFIFYVRKMRTFGKRIGKASGASIGGFISGIFGIGCASCGTFIVTTLLTSIGIGGIITVLPLGGKEFGILGIALLLYSQFLLVRHIQQSNLCPI